LKTLVDIMGRVALPLVTPFTTTENINLDALSALIDYVITNHYCDSIILTGTNGEFYALTEEERIEIWKTAREVIAGRVPMIAAVGTPSTRSTVRLAKVAEELGYDVAMVVLPYYSKPTQEGLLQHFRSVASAVSLPILVYNIPLFTGVNMEPATLEKLKEVPNIRGIKEEAGIQPIQATDVALRMPSDFAIYCGDDTMVLQVLPQRGAGAVSGGSHVIGKWMKAMIDAYFQGDNAKASRIYFRMAPLFTALTQNGRVNPIPILRGAIAIKSGIPIGPPRSPQMPATPQELDVVRPILETLADDQLSGI